jgi:hypothetical protein
MEAQSQRTTPNRWLKILKTSPSGKTLFCCQSCGVVSPLPDSECPNLVAVFFKGDEYMMPCSAWPMDPEEYARVQMAKENKQAFFSGTVVLPDGTSIQIAAPIDGEVATLIAAISVEYNLMSVREKQKEDTIARQKMTDMAVKAPFASVGQSKPSSPGPWPPRPEKWR